MTFSDHSFAYVSDLVRHEAARRLSPGKERLVEARLLPLARAAGCVDVDAYVTLLRADAAHRQDAVDALMDTETSWFRDNTPFISLATAILPDLLRRRADTRHLTFWSAGCASGQEAYSLAMVLDERLPQGWTAEVWASDVSATMVERVRAGRYSQVEMNRGLPVTSLVKYFDRVGTEWRVSTKLRDMVRAVRVNLAAPLPPMPQFDVVFLRNLLTHLDDETAQLVVDGVHGVTAPEGYLVLGTAEATRGLGPLWFRDTCGRITAHRPLRPEPLDGGAGSAATDTHTYLMTGA